MSQTGLGGEYVYALKEKVRYDVDLQISFKIIAIPFHHKHIFE